MTPEIKKALDLALDALKYGIVMLNHLGKAARCMPLHEAANADMLHKAA